MPDNFVTSIAQTPDGYIWIGTYNGLARFDGSRFVIFNPANTPQLGHARIYKVLVDAQGTLWINTYDGSLTTYSQGTFTREWQGHGKDSSEAWLVSSDAYEIIFAFRSGLLLRRSVAAGESGAWRVLEPPGTPPGAVYCQDQAGTLWCSTLDGKLWRIIDDRFELLAGENGLRGREIHWLASDLSKRIWVGTEKEMARWDGQRFQDMNPADEPDLNVASLFFTQDGGAVVAANGRLRKWLDRTWVAELNAEPDLMQEQELWPVLHQDREGGLWQVSQGMGIFHLTPDNVSEQITMAEGLLGDHTTCCLEDQEGNFWIGLGRGGVARLRKKHFETIGMPAGLPPHPAVSVCEDGDHALWIGTYGGGLNRWQNGLLTNFHISTSNASDFVFSVYPDSPGRLWLSAGMEDIYTFQAGQLTRAPRGVHGIKCILVDSRHRTWLGKNRGVDCWADGKLAEWDPHHASIPKAVRTLAEDRQGVIWAGCDDENIYRFDPAGPRPFQLPQFSGPQAVWSLLADADGSLWIGTSAGGLLHYEAGRFSRFTSKDGLPDDMICQILDDQHGNLWIGSHHGICRVSKASLNAFAAGQATTLICSIYDRSDGLPGLNCSDMYQPAAWRGHDGKLWFATDKGVVGVQPEEVPRNLTPPRVVIEEFWANGEKQPTSLPGNNSGAVKLKIPPGQQDFGRICLHRALSLTDADKIHFRYRLEGFDSGWVDAGSRRWVQYNYLKPGTYRFRVAACNNDGVWNETGTAIDLQILPHFWETSWFLAGLGLVLIAGAASVARFVSHRGLRREVVRLEHQREIEQDRARIARDIHDHIGSGLTQINLLNELMLGDATVRLPDRVAQITGVTCELMRTMDEIVWAVNPKNDTLDSLMGYLCDFAGEYLRARQKSACASTCPPRCPPGISLRNGGTIFFWRSRKS